MDPDKLAELAREAAEKAIKEALASEPAAVQELDQDTIDKVFEAKKLGRIFTKSVNGVSQVLLEANIKAVGTEGARTRDSYRPSVKQLKAINKVAKEDQDATMGYVFTFQATNKYNGIDRSLQSLSDGALKRMGQMAVKNIIPFLLASKSDCEDHTWKAINAMGYIIDFEVKEGALFYDVYVPEDEETKSVLNSIFNGRLNKLSVGFGMTWAGVTCNSCNKLIASDDCPHEPGTKDEKGKLVSMTIQEYAILDNYEISGVAVPCQAEAAITREKSLPSDNASVKSYIAREIGELTPSEIKTIEEIDSAGQVLILNELKEVLGLDPITVDKISDGNTIEDNRSMDQENQTNAVDNAPAVDAPAQETVVTNAAPAVESQTEVISFSEDKLCKVAENIKSQVVAELKEVVLAQKLDNSEVLEAIKSLKEDLVKELAEVKALKEQVEAVKSELKADLAVAASVPTQTITNAAGMSSATKGVQVSPDNLLGPLLG